MAEHSYDAIPDFGALYDAVPLYAARADVPFYVGEAARAGGEVLELGCGTGRILLPIARAGQAITGLDASRAMLERCRTNLDREPDAVRSRVSLQQGDVRAFDFGRRFPLILAPFRVMQHLVGVDDQLRFIDAVARHLAPSGRFVFDVFNPSFGLMVSRDGEEHEDTPETALPGGRTMRRAVRVKGVRWLDQVNEIELIYYVAPARGAPAERYVQAFDMRWYLRAELIHLLARGGLRVEATYGDFARGPLVDGAPEIIVSAAPA
jgi:SAM-dependent methyltransferase